MNLTQLYVCGVSYRAHTEPLFLSLKILNVKNIYNYKIAMFMFNVKRGYYPTYICNMFEYNTIYYHYCTRQQQKFHIPSCREKIFRKIALDIKEY